MIQSQRSAAKYRAVRSALGEPDPFRLQHRQLIKPMIADIVRNRLNRERARATAEAFAEAHLDLADRVRFRVVIESELDSLHEGNFARYQVRPSEFEAWRASWP